jgi:ATP-binding cassette subfamily B multidrug efflux pump
MRIILRIIAIALDHKWRLIAAYGCVVGATAAYLVLPKFIGAAVDEVANGIETGEISEGVILRIALAILGLTIIRGVLSFGQNYLGEALSIFVAYDLRNRFYDHVQRLGFGFHDKYHTGNLMSRAVNDVDNIRMFINMGLVRTPYFVALFFIVATLLIALDWRLGLLSASFMPIVAFYSSIVRLKMRRIWLRVQERMADMSTVLQENLSGVRVVKAFSAETYEETKFDSMNTAVATEYVAAERLQAHNTSFVLFTFMLALGLVMWLGGRQVINGSMEWGELAQFIIYMQMLQMPVRMTAFLVQAYARAASAGQRLFEILDAKSPVQEIPDARELPRVQGKVRFDNVGFGYDGGLPVLHDINLEVESGQVIALLGAPGSGKTTIVNLLPRFYDVSSGSVMIDGDDVRNSTLESLRRNIGIVQQDVFLFTSSIKDNIAYGREDATMEEIIQAAKVAQLHDFIETLEAGYDTVIGERGSTLSGGQRQRLSIARAVLLDPPILVLDDSTSSVDAKTEDMIRKAMESVMRGRTTFVIAHRLSTVHKADMILVLRDGEIAESGTHRELLALGGQYREIYDLQLRPQEEVMREIEAPAGIDGGNGR